ncbi:MAG TPA: type I-C CRISPR-associated protein Cas7/Csd2 [Bacillota bacterium]|jgi:CRISPR-associated protein Csd2|nr:type I-C CRISPR-associated protein Cas7/Csd2 [Bacillota bacterium]HPO97978.1 type I-C CRISPR-associated protein Cas7/Csd2 [Bacillota bacterium]
MSEVIKNRYEFVVLFDVENGNPNGDPDAANMPRIDAETNYGIVTDVCIKRKIRNYVEVKKNDYEKYKIYVKEGVPLDVNRKWAYEETGVKVPNGAEEPKDKEEYKKITKFMCDNFYDIRTFGAVMTLKYNCGQVRGPVQINFARSIEPIVPSELTITSCTYANEGESSSKMGRKHIIPYALYKAEGYVSANIAKKITGFSEDDLELLWEAIINMFEHDHSAARGKMAVRKLIVFKHDSELGNVQSHKLFDTITIKRNDESKPARSFSDYIIAIDKDKIPSSVTLIEKL